MLILSRKRDEKIVIGHGADAVELTVVDVRGDKVRLGFVADREVKIFRGELVIPAAARAAAQP